MFETRLVVRFGEVDRAGIVYYPVVQHYCHVVFEDFFAEALGTPYARLLEERNLGFPTVRAETEFHAPFRFGDEVRAALLVEDVGRTSVRWRYEFREAGSGRQLATSRNVTVCVGMDDFRPRRVPDDLRAAFFRHRSP